VVAALAGDTECYWLLAADNGYGFRVLPQALHGHKKSGKAVFNLGPDAQLVAPSAGMEVETDQVVLVTTAGYVLAMAAQAVVELQRGKGQRLIKLGPEERLHTLLIVPTAGRVRIEAGKRHVTLKTADLENYSARRGQRGFLLPRGLQKVDRVQLI